MVFDKVIKTIRSVSTRALQPITQLNYFLLQFMNITEAGIFPGERSLLHLFDAAYSNQEIEDKLLCI